MKVLGASLGEAQSMGRVRSENCTLNRTNIVRVTEWSVLRSKKRLNSGGLEDPVQDSPSGYGFCIHNRSISHF